MGDSPMTSTDQPLDPANSQAPAPAAVIAPPSPPVVTIAILLVLFVVFAGEIIYGIGAPSGLLQPTIATLVAFGGLSKDLVVRSGEYYRLLSDPSPQVGYGLRTLLAIAVSGNHPEEAIETARPVCTALKDGPFRKLLDQRRLCPLRRVRVDPCPLACLKQPL